MAFKKGIFVGVGPPQLEEEGEAGPNVAKQPYLDNYIPSKNNCIQLRSCLSDQLLEWTITAIAK